MFKNNPMMTAQGKYDNFDVAQSTQQKTARQELATAIDALMSATSDLSDLVGDLAGQAPDALIADGSAIGYSEGMFGEMRFSAQRIRAAVRSIHEDIERVRSQM